MTNRRPTSDAQSTPKIAIAIRQSRRLLSLLSTPVNVTNTEAGAGDPDNWDLIGPAMLFSASNCLISLMHLATGNVPRREQDASVLLRRLYEHVVDFAWIAINPRVYLKRWVADYYYYRLELEKDLEHLGRPSLPAEVRQHYDTYIASVRGLPNVLQRAEAADSHWSTRIEAHGTFPQAPAPPGQDLVLVQDGRWSFRAAYAFIYRAGSASAHPTPMSLHDYVYGGDKFGTFRVGLNLAAPDNRYGYTMAPLIFATMLLIAEQVVGWPDSEAVYEAFGD